MESFPKSLGLIAHSTVTSANPHHNKYEVNNPKVSSLSLTGPRNQQLRRGRWRRTSNRQCVRGIGDSGMTTEAAALRWRAWGIGDHDGGVYRERWYQGLDDNNRGVNWGSRRYKVSEWTSLTAEAPVRLRAQDIDNDNGGVGRVRRACGLSNNGGGVGRGQGIYEAIKRSQTATEAAGTRQQAQGIYDKDRGIGGGRWAQRIQRWKRRRRQKIDNASKGLETTKEAAADWKHARWIGNDNRVLIVFAIGFLTVTLFCLCLFAVSFWYCFHQIPFFCLLQEILSLLQSCGKYFCTKFTLTLRM